MAAAAAKTPRARRREATIEAILATSLALVAEEGVDGLTIGRLAAELDYTKGAFYRYFSSKDAILVALQVRLLGQLEQALQRLFAELKADDADDDPLADVLAAARLYAALPAHAPAAYALIHASTADPRDLVDASEAAPTAAAMASVLGAIAVRLEDAANAGKLSPGSSSHRAVALWSALHGHLMVGKFARFDPDLFDPARLCRSTTTSLLVGWGGMAGEVEAADRAVAARAPDDHIHDLIDRLIEA